MSGGGNNKAADQARADEQARQAAIARTQGAVNQVFDDPKRKADIADYVGATRQYLTRDLDEQKVKTDRELTFSLARSGNTGGSLQVDKQAQFGRDYSKGLLQVDRTARGDGADLEAADQDARARLIQLSTSGLDVTTAAAQSAAALRSSLEAGKAASQTQGLGDVFGQFTKFYQDSRDQAERRKAEGSPPLSRTLTRRPIEALRSVHVEAKEVQC
ncbi:MAG: hypothetical protein ACREO8_06605 [Luteimonas sp.]